MENVPPPPPPPPPSRIPPPPTSPVAQGPIADPPAGPPVQPVPGSPTTLFGGSPPPPIDPSRGDGTGGSGRALIVVSVVGLLALVALVVAVVALITRDGDDEVVVERPLVSVPSITVPSITVPSIAVPSIAVPPITVPSITVPAESAPTAGEITVPADSVPGTEPAVMAPPTTAPEPVDLFAGSQAGDVVGEVAEARGADPLRILRAAIYPEYAFLQVQDPTIPEHVDEYRWRGTLDEPSPVRLVGTGDLEENLFSAHEADWSVIPVLVAAAPSLTEISDGEVSHVIVERPLPFSADVRMRVFVTGARNSGYVDADAAGNVIDVNRS